MSIDRQAIVAVLEEIAAYLALKGEDQFRVRAYASAARAIQSFHGDLGAALQSGALAELRGVGSTTLSVIRDVRETGASRMLEDLRDQIPPGLVEMLAIPGLGVSKVRQIHDTLHIDTIEELDEAARDGRLATLPRFGPRTAEKVLKGIEALRHGREFRLLHHARQEALALRDVLAQFPEVARTEVAGSVRRGRELIRDLDFVVELTGSPQSLVERLGHAVGVREFVNRSDRTVTLRFARGTVADIYWSDRDQFGFQLLHATGSREHLHQLALRASQAGLGWSETGLSKDGTPISAPTEETVYRALGLPYIPPELREGLDEIAAAAAGRLPRLIEPGDLQGFLHCHSEYSDGGSTVREWADACRARGYRYLGITDHSEAMAYAGGLTAERVPDQHAEIARVNRDHPDFRVLKGVEADILEDGALDYAPEVRRTFDFIIASVHARHGMSERAMTQRILAAMRDPTMAVLGHPTGRLLLSRDPFPVDLDAVFARAAELGVAIEINADPQRLDLDWRLARRAAEAGVVISIGADAHSVAGIDNMELGVIMARKGWLTADQVLNARPLDGFLEHVRRRRRP